MTAAGCRYLTARLAVDCHNLLGEGAVWSRRRGTLLWVDIEGRLLQEMKPPAARGEAHKYTSWSLNERPGTVALTDRSNEVLLALEGGLSIYDLETSTVRHRLEEGFETKLPSTRPNDGRVDRQGRCDKLQQSSQMQWLNEGAYCDGAFGFEYQPRVPLLHLSYEGCTI